MAKATMTAAAMRRERGRQEMREQILATARRMVQEEGVEALSVRAVARAMGYSPASLYEYFPAKEDILAGLYFEGADGLNGRMLEAMAALPTETPTDAALAVLGRAYRAYAHEQPELYRLVLGGPAHHHGAPAEDPPPDGFNVLVELGRRGIARGDFVPLPPPVFAVAAWAAVHGFVSLELAGMLTGGPHPGAEPASAEEGRAARDGMFEALIRMVLVGFVQRGDEPAGMVGEDRS